MVLLSLIRAGKEPLIIPFINSILSITSFDDIQKEAFENIVGKGENAS